MIEVFEFFAVGGALEGVEEVAVYFDARREFAVEVLRVDGEVACVSL